MTSSGGPTRARRSGSTAILLVLVVAVGLCLGILTAFAQEWLPEELGSLANSSGPWALVAFVLALRAADGRVAAVVGFLSLLTLLLGYVLGSSARGFPAGAALVLFWSVAALVAGPVLGIGAAWVKAGNGMAAAAGIGMMSGVLIGEGAYGLAYIADTTYPPYWSGEIAVGVALLALVVLARLRRTRTGAAAVLATALTAIAFVLVYSQNLIALLP
jgi:hypothetical protein